MPLIAQNHFQLILEVAIILYAGAIFLINLTPITLSTVFLVALFLAVVLTILFGIDVLLMILYFGQHEFTHPYGPIALAVIITSLAGLKIMDRLNIETSKLRELIYLLIIGITIFGGMIHRSFLVLWFLGLFIGMFIISKSFGGKSIITPRKVLSFTTIALAMFMLLELLSRIFKMPILSPLLRIGRIENYALPSVQFVLKNMGLIGHNPSTSYWGEFSSGFADGYITLPITLIVKFGLPYPIFYGVLVNEKDTIDYMLPGIFGWGYDFGFLVLIFFLLWFVSVTYLGLRLLKIYKKKREGGIKRYLGREILLIGVLTAFVSQGLVGIFLINRSINESALLTFIFLSSLIVGQVIKVDEK
ncbi:conserved hypothetical protein [Methanothermus fervidus DSM 2088]|uniref:Oligosaccharide repeat unit polymerase n=1 Tax=Methanothermus fervidus (strain ATCC 43054 / DSM 2088 / JCM 10308 / V24 S) TaxID=523846 RepID=E3GXN0_METFV|nr:hypothetical protein [Methanothermus fervidus]ADP77062.1 conserved hypothetical protein [Methanothermus fervidus DSM 2088]